MCPFRSYQYCKPKGGIGKIQESFDWVFAYWKFRIVLWLKMYCRLWCHSSPASTFHPEHDALDYMPRRQLKKEKEVKWTLEASPGFFHSWAKIIQFVANCRFNSFRHQHLMLITVVTDQPWRALQRLRRLKSPELRPFRPFVRRRRCDRLLFERLAIF